MCDQTLPFEHWTRRWLRRQEHECAEYGEQNRFHRTYPGLKRTTAKRCCLQLLILRADLHRELSMVIEPLFGGCHDLRLRRLARTPHPCYPKLPTIVI
jgi:hypothetical protein